MPEIRRERLRRAVTQAQSDQRHVERLFVGWFVFVALIAVTIIGVGVWAVIELVQWVTAQ